MSSYQPLSRLLLLSTIQTLIPALLLITTPKRSPLRYLSIPCMIFILSMMLHPVKTSCYLAGTSAGAGWMSILFALDILLINPKHAEDFINNKKITTNSFLSRLKSALELRANLRRVNTPRETKNIPPFPKYYAKRGITRGRFLVRETVIAVWQYLVLDVLTVELWIERLITTLVAWFIVSRILSEFYYRSFAVPCVALRVESPENFPTLFNKMVDAYTLRGFWGKFWHQTLRTNFTAVSNFLTRDILNLPKPSLLERYTNVFLVFCLSGIMHVVIDVVSNIPVRESGAMRFFLSFPFGYMIEDGVQAGWRKLQGSKKKAGTEAEWWERAIGFVWVVGFLTVTFVPYSEPMQKGPERLFVLVSWSIVKVIGVKLVGGLIVGVGVLIMVVFGGEV
ncbi:hypothetical protein BO94DRAFT_563945 [Aspergillus sclerotioniger CBS 115572]|uniref:Wax synthase domain-containing protein n=1 Tax=Aspergillus sclerotioniger CBS 115572 TaxID=1450535 RepID=A0A317X5F9_9EURO|nr:hypothetical protein BO94DRAFT_563945 [Aspergillus sclerotioniger CBS 115572]PWY93565.1 hypothetical protein BO94DRAFT_563945 [Aspergillus sclerotioniger CBS 115572]